MKNNLIIFGLFTLLIGPRAIASGSVIGNGGDPIFYFLEATRNAFIETLKMIATDADERTKFCAKANLNAEQIIFCRSFFLEIIPQVIAQNQGPKKTLFVLREEPLMVIGPDGKPMPVAAKTLLGPNGEIEFHRDTIKVMPPTQALFLIAHEFQHKVSFNNNFTTDNDPIGPFAIGRDLIDAVAAAVVDVAKRKGKIGTQYSLRDRFDCLARVNGVQFGNIQSTPRLFLSEDLMSYETSISKNPRDPMIYVPETGNSIIIFRMTISEPGNCSDDHQYVEKRNTKLELVRSYKSDETGNHKPEEVLVEKGLRFYSPICDQSGTKFSIAYGETMFTCQYNGTEGQAASWSRQKMKRLVLK